jgi:hypothetical protein
MKVEKFYESNYYIFILIYCLHIFDEKNFLTILLNKNIYREILEIIVNES